MTVETVNNDTRHSALYSSLFTTMVEYEQNRKKTSQEEKNLTKQLNAKYIATYQQYPTAF